MESGDNNEGEREGKINSLPFLDLDGLDYLLEQSDLIRDAPLEKSISFYHKVPHGNVLFTLKTERQTLVYPYLASFVGGFITVGPGDCLKNWDDPEIADIVEHGLRGTTPALISSYWAVCSGESEGFTGLLEIAGSLKIQNHHRRMAKILDYAQRLILLTERYKDSEADEQKANDFKSGVYNNHGYAYLQLGQPESALLSLHVARQFDPQQRFVNNNMAEAFEALGKTKRAKKYYQRELEIEPEHPTARESLERLCA